MSNIIFLSSVTAAIIWVIAYLLVAASPFVHLLLVIAFIGTVISVLMDENKRGKNYQSK